MAEPNALKKCDGCSQLNDLTMLFCLRCGQKLSDPEISSQVLSSQEKVCKACGKADALSDRFCIFCGSEVVAQVVPISQPMVALKRSWMCPRPLVVAALSLAGVLSGLLLVRAIPSMWMEELAARSNWPSRGLVVYAQPSGGQIEIEENTGRTFTLGCLGKDGAFSVADLAPGNYRVILSHSGYRNYIREVQIEPDQVAVLGFPSRIQLIGNNIGANQADSQLAIKPIIEDLL